MTNIDIHRQTHERAVAERQRKHMEKLNNNNWKPCLHDACQLCHGTGIGRYGPCVHMVSCTCPKCAIT